MFAERRERLIEALGEEARGRSAVVLVAGEEAVRNGDVEHPFRQTSTFHYLTGFPEPEAVAVLRPGQEEAAYALFVRPHDPRMAVWVGPRAGVEGAIEQYGADVAYDIDDLEEELPGLLRGLDTVYFGLGSGGPVEELLTSILAQRRDAANRGVVPIARVIDPVPTIDALRLVKSDDEIASLQRAIDVTGAGLEAAMRGVRPGMHEYEVQAMLEAEYRRRGSPRDGFPSIVAGGERACTLHYTSNRARIEDGDLLLLDTGAEWDYYSADVSRTFPVNGRFTPEQRAVYEIVLESQRQGIERAAPGVPFDDVHQASLRVLVQGLVDLEVLSGDIDGLIEEQAYRPYYMHATSHWLGLDVHDVGHYRTGEASTPLGPGMVLTVEPGLYLAPHLEAVPEPLRGIGVRIEDDVLVTPEGRRNLSGAIPSAPDALEAIVGQG